MLARVDSKVAPSRDYQDYVPNTEIVEEKDCETLLIYLPGFKKDQLRIQITRTQTLKISGERSIGDNKWSRFKKEFPVSKNCDTDEITAKFESGILYIRQPKKDDEKPVDETQNPQNTETKNASNKMEDEDKLDSKVENSVDNVAQKSRERVDEFLRGDFIKGRVNMAKKTGTTTTSVIVIVLVAIMLGIYIKNLIMPGFNYEN